MPGTPRSYDDIIAHTVPDPDSSYRPTAQQRRDAFLYVDPPRDEALAAKVYEALREIGAQHLAVEVDGSRVILRGVVVDHRTLRRIETTVRAVDGVEDLDDRTHFA